MQEEQPESKIAQFNHYNLPIDDGINEFNGPPPGLGEYCKIQISDLDIEPNMSSS